MNVCVVSQHFYPTFGGAALRFLRYSPGLKARGVNVHVLTGTAPTDRAIAPGGASRDGASRTGELLPPESINDALVHRLQLPDSGELRRGVVYGKGLLRFVAGGPGPFDVIQIVGIPPGSTPWLFRLRRLKIPIVFAYTLAAHPSGNPLVRMLQRFYRGSPMRLADRVVASSKVVRDQILDLGIRTPIEVIPNGVDLCRFRPPRTGDERRKVRQLLGLPVDGQIVLSVGGVDPRKGTDFLLRVWSELAAQRPRAHFVLVGPRNDLANPRLEEFRRQLETLVAGSGGPERVHFVGLVDNVEEYFRAADVFVFASRREGMGNVILEAMATGLPVITTPFLGLPEEIGRPGEQYHLVGREPREMATLIDEVLDEPDSRGVSTSARAWAEEELDVEHALDRYANLYRELAGGALHGSGRPLVA